MVDHELWILISVWFFFPRNSSHSLHFPWVFAEVGESSEKDRSGFNRRRIWVFSFHVHHSPLSVFRFLGNNTDGGQTDSLAYWSRRLWWQLVRNWKIQWIVWLHKSLLVSTLSAFAFTCSSWSNLSLIMQCIWELILAILCTPVHPWVSRNHRPSSVASIRTGFCAGIGVSLSLSALLLPCWHSCPFFIHRDHHFHLLTCCTYYDALTIYFQSVQPGATFFLGPKKQLQLLQSLQSSSLHYESSDECRFWYSNDAWEKALLNFVGTEYLSDPCVPPSVGAGARGASATGAAHVAGAAITDSSSAFSSAFFCVCWNLPGCVPVPVTFFDETTFLLSPFSSNPFAQLMIVFGDENDANDFYNYIRNPEISCLLGEGANIKRSQDSGAGDLVKRYWENHRPSAYICKLFEFYLPNSWSKKNNSPYQNTRMFVDFAASGLSFLHPCLLCLVLDSGKESRSFAKSWKHRGLSDTTSSRGIIRSSILIILSPRWHIVIFCVCLWSLHCLSISPACRAD